MKKRYFLEITILVLAIILISFSAQADTINPSNVNALNLETSFLLTEESQDFAPVSTGLLTEESQNFTDLSNPLLTEESQNFASVSTGIYGWVTDKFTGKPIPGEKVYVRFACETEPVVTGWLGEFGKELPTLGADELAIIVVEVDGYWPAFKIRVIHPGEWTRQDFKLDPYPQP